MIFSRHETYLIENAHKYFNRTTEFHSVIYSDQSIIRHQPYHDLINQSVYDLADQIMPQVEHQLTKRRMLPIPKNKFCYTRLVADYRFLRYYSGGSVRKALSDILYMFSVVQRIFRNADFDDDGEADNITVSLLETTILTAPDPRRYGSNYISRTSLMRLFSSQPENSRFCNALLLTYRDFNGYIAQYYFGRPGTSYGICRRFNTNVVTLNLRGRRQSTFIGALIIAHVFGHNFGAPVSKAIFLLVIIFVIIYLHSMIHHTQGNAIPDILIGIF